MTRKIATLITGISIIIVTNVIALAGVAYNRSGEPDPVIELSERELITPSYSRMNKENSGLALRIGCRLYDGRRHYYGRTNCNGEAEWLDQEKLVELGFEPTQNDEKTDGLLDGRIDLPRKVYLVLEFDGDVYRKALADAAENLRKEQATLADNPGKREFEKRVERAKKRFDDEEHRNSRLFAIDAGLDKARLRAEYADGNRYIIMQGLIRVFRNGGRNEEKWRGHVNGLLINRINIPLADRAPFEAVEKGARRYRVRVAFGQRAEPWLVSVTR